MFMKTLLICFSSFFLIFIIVLLFNYLTASLNQENKHTSIYITGNTIIFNQVESTEIDL